MKKLIVASALAAIVALSGCGNSGPSQADLDKIKRELQAERVLHEITAEERDSAQNNFEVAGDCIAEFQAVGEAWFDDTITGEQFDIIISVAIEACVDGVDDLTEPGVVS